MYTQVGQLVIEHLAGARRRSEDARRQREEHAEKERLAASRADAYLDRMMAGQAQPISVPPPLKKMLDAKYESSVNSAGLDRALERAQKTARVGGLGAHGEPAEVGDPDAGRCDAAGRAACGCTAAGVTAAGDSAGRQPEPKKP